MIAILVGAAATTWGAAAAFADDTQQCAGLPSQGALKNALRLARNQANGGFNLDMWATVVNRRGQCEARQAECIGGIRLLSRDDAAPGAIAARDLNR